MVAESMHNANVPQPPGGADCTRERLTLALQCAMPYRGWCSPNPAVGAVLYKENQLIAKGAHVAAGQAHAEVVAIEQAGSAAKGATMYVTLEPCNHQGRTPPCTQALVRAGIKHVIYAQRDPNPQVQAGQTERQLRAAGVLCWYFPLPEITAFYASYRHWHRHRRPLITTKLATTLDGAYAQADGAPLSITGALAQQFTHQKRFFSDVVMTGIETIIHDNPQFNVRLRTKSSSVLIRAKPLLILDRQARFPVTARCLASAASVTILHDATAPVERLSALQAAGVRCVSTQHHQGCMWSTLEALSQQHGWHDVWCESGPKLQQWLWSMSKVDVQLRYIAPWVQTGAAQRLTTETVTLPASWLPQWLILGEDVCLQAVSPEQADGLEKSHKLEYHWGQRFEQIEV
jgi:diaminohydroxyphosphoribosylaminopyrimidine deaminase/5-amino-6-(5-phosphoribosylamino)uracil reductase